MKTHQTSDIQSTAFIRSALHRQTANKDPDKTR